MTKAEQVFWDWKAGKGSPSRLIGSSPDRVWQPNAYRKEQVRLYILDDGSRVMVRGRGKFQQVIPLGEQNVEGC